MQDELTIETKQATEAKTDDNNIVIKVEHLQKSFEDNKVLKDINLTLCKGENLVVLGRSGQGKSVTIQCIVGLLDYDEGSLKVFGKEIKELLEDELKEIRLKLGFLFQSGALYDSMTVRENLSFPLTRVLKMKDDSKINQEVEDVLDAVGLKDAIDKMPGDLSGGMRKRIGLARTLILKPAIMLYDEPTTGLDPITSKEISQLIMDLRKKYQTSSIIITHDLACAKITGDRILVLHEGKFIAEGSYKDLEKSQDERVNSFFK
ncbi:ABC transporter ATP-binding protein [Pinibacter aurantiacus]|uniref:ATP-binding cassette domain-containing protein n=1 Tax=Pinibacter aurantiacus TaxID=2851599 RepID=A0A9E2S7S3_9BACT|nr:ATP-binding cassette domain-containing protein [Pinibacter aurantiacus]MBV4357446.1 ATP-binding cassette domain-containing protein [Pinibacter aurantiacus]